MKLVRFQLKNYKSIFDSGEVVFGDGFNVIVGPNNAGKSALLQGISLRFGNVPHLSLRTKPTLESVVQPRSEALFAIEVSGSEFRNRLLTRGGQFHIPLPVGESGSHEMLNRTLKGIFNSERIMVQLVKYGDSDVVAAKVPSFDKYKPAKDDMIGTVSANRQSFEFAGQHGGHSVHEEIGSWIGRAFREQLYFFHAERLRIAEGGFGSNPILQPDASNLPEVLNVLQSNVERFGRFNRYMNQIFPTIRRVAVRPNISSNNLQIVVWTVDPATEREDLAISLADSGTGVSQVLAILYVAVTSPPPLSRTIVIDEPNSFLNPGSAKKLIEILKSFGHLQFIISTHSPEIIRAAGAPMLAVIHWNEGASTVEQIGANRVESFQQVLREVGASLSDVFGADRIVWVEGITEEICFRVLIERLLKRPLIGTAIIAVRDVGRLATPRPSAALVWEIYIKLSEAGSLLPPALAFSFDREGRSDREINDIIRQSKGKVRFLPRRMFENFLLDEDAIAAVISSELQNSPVITNVEIREWIKNYAGRFSSSEAVEVKGDMIDWNKDVDGAALLNQMFLDLTGNKVVYDKVRHASAIIDWLICNSPDALAELHEYVNQLLEPQG